jgi:type II secretory pathway pseudopilin PulG
MNARTHQSGSTLAMALITIAILAFAAASVFYYITNRSQTSANAGSWQEALVVAESGTDMAMSALNASVKNPGTAWTAWTPSDATTFPKTYTGVLPAHAGEGNKERPGPPGRPLMPRRFLKPTPACCPRTRAKGTTRCTSR